MRNGASAGYAMRAAVLRDTIRGTFCVSFAVRQLILGFVVRRFYNFMLDEIFVTSIMNEYSLHS